MCKMHSLNQRISVLKKKKNSYQKCFRHKQALGLVSSGRSVSSSSEANSHLFLQLAVFLRHVCQQVTCILDSLQVIAHLAEQEPLQVVS